jgi:hypothetical protein
MGHHLRLFETEFLKNSQKFVIQITAVMNNVSRQ